MKIKKILLGLLLIITISFVTSYKLEKETINQIAIHGYEKPAEFIFKFGDAEEGFYEIFTFVDVELSPKEKFEIKNKTENILVKVYPTEKISEIKGLFSFIFYIQKPNKENKEERLRINLKNIEEIFEVNSEANFPGEGIFFYLENKENVSLKDLKVKFRSILFEEERKFDIKPFEKKEFFVKVDKKKLEKTPAGSYLIEIDFIAPNNKIYTKQGKFLIGEKKDIFNDYKKEGFLVKEEIFIKRNLGNTLENVQFEVEKNIFSAFFTSFSEKADRIETEGLKKKFYWTKKIGPSESSEIKVRTNYLLPLIALILIIGFTFLSNKYYSAKLKIIKSVQPLKTKGGEFAVRVKIKIKANAPLRNVSINEKVPSFLKIYKKFSSLSPNKIDEKNGKITLNLGDLFSGEERTFNYILYSKVGVYGKIFFPETNVIYEVNNKVYETLSNKVFFLSEQAKK